MKKTILSNADYLEFYKYDLFGNVDDEIRTAIKRAYRDFNRTIRGFSKNKERESIKDNANELLFGEINHLLTMKINKQEDFDSWHKTVCDKLISLFTNQELHYGQAQKWINMTLKYIALLNYDRVKNIYEFCHVPVDNDILGIVSYKFDSKWSRIDNYKDYIEFQKWFQNTYTNIPLDEEFILWLKAKKTAE